MGLVEVVCDCGKKIEGVTVGQAEWLLKTHKLSKKHQEWATAKRKDGTKN